MADEGVDLLGIVGVDDQPRLLVEEQDVLVLVDDVEMGRQLHERLLDGGVGEEFLREEELYGVALLEDIADLGALAVDLDLLGADGFVHERLGQGLDGFREEFVEALARVVGFDGESTHLILLR